MEWNIKETIHDMKYIMSTVMIDLLCFIMLYTLIYNENKFNYYSIYQMVFSIILLMFSLSNYIFLYLINIIKIFVKTDDEIEAIIKECLNFGKDNEPSKLPLRRTTYNSNNNVEATKSDITNKTRTSRIKSIVHRLSTDSINDTVCKIIECHYRDSIENNSCTLANSSLANDATDNSISNVKNFSTSTLKTN
ncbi:hypothetical protein BCR32DRAFT_163876 [Anaeromyces robustus]|uniref:Uncharacterized protein n=1 Tax=Anaeromyces robustus TaxID=1754192 RepID=A0A1Y1X9P5_9FUNG|nr:hypothetical protein BCR32DRAFT_163876 [Anaeromyces robustus]|eukprot:ORX82463.1 hypothetical protein BCR32DRAFT_163876 [Anaeromyces robustus]